MLKLGPGKIPDQKGLGVLLASFGVLRAKAAIPFQLLKDDNVLFISVFLVQCHDT